MNYGKKAVSKKRNALISSSSMMGKRAHVSFIRVLFISLITLCVVVACLGFGALRGVVDTVDHGVLKGNAPPGLIVILPAALDQLLHPPAPVGRHDPGAGLVIRRVEGDGQGQL